MDLRANLSDDHQPMLLWTRWSRWGQQRAAEVHARQGLRRTLGSQCTGGGDELGSKVEVLTLYLRGREESKRVRNTTKVRMQVEAGLMEAKS